MRNNSGSSLFIKCENCNQRPATIKCFNCKANVTKLCYTCDNSIHTKLRDNPHKTDIIPYHGIFKFKQKCTRKTRHKLAQTRGLTLTKQRWMITAGTSCNLKSRITNWTDFSRTPKRTNTSTTTRSCRLLRIRKSRNCWRTSRWRNSSTKNKSVLSSTLSSLLQTSGRSTKTSQWGKTTTISWTLSTTSRKTRSSSNNTSRTQMTVSMKRPTRSSPSRTQK